MVSVHSVRVAVITPEFTRNVASAPLQSVPSTSFSFPCVQGVCFSGLSRKETTLHICRAQPDGPSPLGRRERDRQRLEKSLPNFEEITSDEVDTFLDLRRETVVLTDKRNHYEIMFLIHEDNFEEVPAVIEKVKGFIGDNRGTIWRLNDWGLRPLAYKIRKAWKANYVLMNIEVGFDKINDLKTLLDKDERVIRHLVMRMKEAVKKDCEPPPVLERRGSRDLELDDELDEDEDEDEEEDEDVEEREGAQRSPATSAV